MGWGYCSFGKVLIMHEDLSSIPRTHIRSAVIMTIIQIPAMVRWEADRQIPSSWTRQPGLHDKIQVIQGPHLKQKVERS